VPDDRLGSLGSLFPLDFSYRTSMTATSFQPNLM
jgi:hypothetical protein